MARYKATIGGNRGPASRLGSKDSGITAHARGWTCGVLVWGRPDPDTEDSSDVFTVTASGGSNGKHVPRRFAEIRDLVNGGREIVLYHPRTGKVVARHIDR